MLQIIGLNYNNMNIIGYMTWRNKVGKKYILKMYSSYCYKISWQLLPFSMW